ncbi:hypothetical protein, partial [Actinobacillus minor]|uniref:hypothetical protein n=1 Tax=Actinobacillus minor TaxID=51047 RepID=UPI002A82CE5E
RRFRELCKWCKHRRLQKSGNCNVRARHFIIAQLLKWKPPDWEAFSLFIIYPIAPKLIKFLKAYTPFTLLTKRVNIPEKI